MKTAVEKIVKSLVGDADAVEVSEKSDGRSIIFQVRVGKDDMGRIIGREGRTVKAIRSLLFYAGQKHGKRFTLDIVE
ncbi:MAG: KH domain-containing protein [Pyrinomonadaceae bacterium]